MSTENKALLPQNVQYLLLFGGVFSVICVLAGLVLISVPMRHRWGIKNVPNYSLAAEIIRQNEQIFKDMEHTRISTAPTIPSMWRSRQGSGDPYYLIQVDVYAPWKKPGLAQLSLYNSGDQGPVSYTMSWRHNGTTHDTFGTYRGGE